MEKKKTRILPAVIRNKATIEGWLEHFDNNSGVFVPKSNLALLRESNYLVIFKLCVNAAFLKGNAS
ncbi:MAG: hypothetical protein A2W93_06015 [Bacteroidetes bacterium GWF2_43_63]|nr:MAG: hypothetical protein A2W93_06015 [Bacteroidetes bacterium GWF2_43_63]HBG70003.1 hypothetical protein [Bacteroidales bacterium]HCB60739.1 hypothetical protein [Bacteroidales bacterium]HCY22129.1 hypothetical protein [Bacteroidales bacterium]